MFIWLHGQPPGPPERKARAIQLLQPALASSCVQASIQGGGRSSSALTHLQATATATATLTSSGRPFSRSETSFQRDVTFVQAGHFVFHLLALQTSVNGLFTTLAHFPGETCVFLMLMCKSFSMLAKRHVHLS